MKNFDGYLKLKLGNDYVLLAGGSHRHINDFILPLNTSPASTISTGKGTWQPLTGRYVFQQHWTDSSTGSDTADLGIFLDGNLTANMVLDGYYFTLSGYKVSEKDNNSVLLAGGGTKALSDFATASGYVKKLGDTMTGTLTMSAANKIYFPNDGDYTHFYTGGTSEHFSIGYGRIQGYASMYINADTDGSTTEHLLLTAGRGVTTDTSLGLKIGYNTLTWLGNTIWHAGNDGSSSGLDADLLDGYHASSFSLTSHNHDGRYHLNNGGWKSSTLDSYAYLCGWFAQSSNGSYAYAGLCHKDGNMVIYTDGLFYQREGAYYCLDNGNTYVSNGVGVINGNTITSVTNSTNATYATYTTHLNASNLIGSSSWTWNPFGFSTLKWCWGELFKNSDISSDTGDIRFYLAGFTSNGYNGATGVCMNIDGCIASASLIYALLGFIHGSYNSANYLLLSNGSVKATGDFAASNHTHEYLPNNASWIPSSLSNAGMTRRWGYAYSSACMGWASNNSEMYVYTDGTFWQREGAYMCLDTGNWSSYITYSTMGLDNRYVKKSGDTMTGTLTMSNCMIWVQSASAAGNSSNRMGLTSGMPSGMPYNTSKRGLLLYANAIAICDPYNGNSNNDAGWIRHIEESANTGYLEIAVGDDGGNEYIYFRGYNTSSTVQWQGYIAPGADMTMRNFYTTSDARKKQNIHKISDNIKQFEWKETGETSYGFVAQDLEVKHPELVNDDGNMKTVNYNAALSLVVAKLENRVKELEAKLGLETPPCI